MIEISDDDDEENDSHEQTNEIIEEEEGPILRRSTRQSTTPKYLDDYVLFAEEEGEYLLMSVNNEPRDFYEAEECKEWMLACEDEITSIIKNGTWTLVDLPQGAKAIGLKWVVKLKRNFNGSINKHKARLVAKGYVQSYGVDYEEVFAPISRLKTI